MATKFLYNPYIVFAMAIIMTLYVIFVHIYLVKNHKETDEKKVVYDYGNVCAYSRIVD